jgi:hypothetical protein
MVYRLMWSVDGGATLVESFAKPMVFSFAFTANTPCNLLVKPSQNIYGRNTLCLQRTELA